MTKCEKISPELLKAEIDAVVLDVFAALQLQTVSNDAPPPGARSGRDTVVEHICPQQVDDVQLAALYGLMAFMADIHVVSQDRIQMMVEGNFSVSHVTRLRKTDFQGAIDYLIGLHVARAVN